MTETSESATESAVNAAAATVPQPGEVTSGRPTRLYQAAAWVAIVAGIVFIVGAVFFTGFALGRHSGHGGGWDGFRHQGGAMMPRPPMGDPDERCPAMMGPPMMGPGMMGPGMGPGMMGPGMAPGMMGPDGPGARGPSGAPTTSQPVAPAR